MTSTGSPAVGSSTRARPYRPLVQAGLRGGELDRVAREQPPAAVHLGEQVRGGRGVPDQVVEHQADDAVLRQPPEQQRDRRRPEQRAGTSSWAQASRATARSSTVPPPPAGSGTAIVGTPISVSASHAVAKAAPASPSAARARSRPARSAAHLRRLERQLDVLLGDPDGHATPRGPQNQNVFQYY